ncbi:hypothetical protein JMUB5695_01142 [Mycobacterium heckeshornense]|nr:hypothetical protein JMUB5695_01142 [Mycobacterium heckeshornense]
MGQRAAIACEALPLLEEEGRRKKARAVAERNRREAAERRAGQANGRPDVADLPHLGGHLTAGEKALIALESLPIFEASRSNDTPPTDPKSPDGADRHHLGNREKPKQRAPRSSDIAARATGTSGRAVAQFKRIADKAPDLAEKVKAAKKRAPWPNGTAGKLSSAA